MTKFYTLISYLEGESGYHDRCGDYISGEDSEMTIETYHSSQMDELINNYAQLKIKSDESHREITLLLDGVDTYNFPEGLSDDEEQALTVEREQIENLVYEKYEQLHNEKKQREEIKKQTELQLKLKKERDEKERVKQLELMQLAQLQAKYGK